MDKALVEACDVCDLVVDVVDNLVMGLMELNEDANVEALSCCFTDLFDSGYPGSSTEHENVTLFFFTAINGKWVSMAGPGS